MKPTIALFLYDPKCSVQSGNGIIRALQSDYNFKIFSINPLEDSFFNDVDIVAVPGGFGDASTFDRAFKHTKNQIKDFVCNGGKYLGICMGAYWAGKHYFNILKNVDARRPHAKNIDVRWHGVPHNMFFYDGCALVGNPLEYNTIARYANGDAMAIIQDNIGVIGCHPEAESFWYDSYTWMQGKYTSKHRILLDFVNQLNNSC
jgi:Biotin-protein ligase, N terminal